MLVDCRGKDWPEAARILIARFNALAPGDSLETLIDRYPAGFRGWLLEAGLRHRPVREGAAWRLAIRRELAPAQGSVGGVHHILGEAGSVWACKRSPSVARLDPETGEVRSVASVARRAAHMAHSVESNMLFVADSEANQVLALRASDLEVQHRWDAPGGPQLPMVSQGGIVAVTGGSTGTVTLAVPMIGAYSVHTVEVGPGPHDPLACRDGEHLFVGCMGGDLIKVRMTDGVIAGRTKVGEGPSHLARHPARSEIYVANSWDGTLACVSAEGEVLSRAQSGGWAHAIAVTPDGREIWVANFLDDTVAVFSADRLQRIALLETDAYPHGLDISPDGRLAVVTGYSSRHARIFDASTHRLLARVEVGCGGSHTAFGAGKAFIACSVDDLVACVDLQTREVKGIELQ